MKTKNALLDQYETEILAEGREPVVQPIEEAGTSTNAFTTAMLVMLYLAAALACTDLFS